MSVSGPPPDLVSDALPTTATLGVGVYCLDPAGEEVVAYRADQPRAPASNTKLLTTAIALDRLGPAYRARTRFNRAPDGRLIVHGDRTLATDSADLTGAATAIADQVSELSGLVLDVSDHARQPYGPAWTWGDEQRAYGAQCSPLAVDGNVVTVTVGSNDDAVDGDSLVARSVSPASSVTDVDVTATVDAAADPDGGDLDPFRDHETGRLRVTGTLPAGTETTVRLPVGRPLRHYGGVVRQALTESGVQVAGDLTIAREEAPPRDGEPMVTTSSPPLGECCELINRPSDNFMAEQLARTVAGTVHGTDSWDAWGDLVDEVLAARDAAPARIRDGSGLSRYNRIAPRDLVEHIRWALDQPWGETFIESLPVAGESGTLANRPAEFDATVRAKTGTLTGARALSGVIETAAGRAPFSILLGDLAGTHESAGHDHIDALLAALVPAVT